MNGYEPEYFELNDYMVMKHPEVYALTKYMSNMSTQRKIWLQVWKQNGKPDLNVVWEP